MKKILVLLAMLILVCPVMAWEVNSFDVDGTYISNNITSFNSFGTTEYGGSFSFKGLWSDKTGLNKDIMVEEFLCNVPQKLCFSSHTRILFDGCPYLNPYVSTNVNVYEIIEISSVESVLYSTNTQYTVKINFKNKNATKYKVFENGDVNKYSLLLNKQEISSYIKNILKIEQN